MRGERKVDEVFFGNQAVKQVIRVTARLTESRAAGSDQEHRPCAVEDQRER